MAVLTHLLRADIIRRLAPLLSTVITPLIRALGRSENLIMAHLNPGQKINIRAVTARTYIDPLALNNSDHAPTQPFFCKLLTVLTSVASIPILLATTMYTNGGLFLNAATTLPPHNVQEAASSSRSNPKHPYSAAND